MTVIHHTRWLCQLLLITVCLTWQGNLYAVTLEELRLSVGSKLFPTMLAADLHIKDKQGADGALQLLVIYQHSPHSAAIIAEKLTTVSNVKKMPLRITPTALKKLTGADIGQIGGIFVAEPLHDNLSEVLAFARTRKVMVFSPFEGDVELGAHGGISVRDRILPYINPGALRADDIKLKAFFIKVAVQYD